MKLYAWYPEGHGSWSFFVMEETKEDAVKAIKQFIKDSKESNYFYESWPHKYELEVCVKGEVAINNND